MELYGLSTFLSPTFKYEESFSMLQEYKGDHLTIQLDPNTKSETEECSEADISLSNFIDDDCVSS